MVKFLSSRKKKILLFVALPLLIISGLIIFTVKALNSPAEGVIASTNTYDSFTKKSDDLPKKFSDKFISFTYPSKYSVNQSQKETVFIDTVDLFSTDHTSKHIAIGIFKGSLENESGVNYRKGHPELYKLVSSTSNYYVFKKSANGSEYTGFIQHDEKIISISVTTPFNKELSKDYQTIANSLQWKQ
jgi:hypothetical protein